MNSLPSPQAMVWLQMRWVLLRHLNWRRALVGLLAPLLLLLFLQEGLGLSRYLAPAGMAALLGIALFIMPLRQLWQQNDPRAARLVPGHLRTLRHASWLAVGTMVAAIALLNAWLRGLSPGGLLLIAAGVVTLAWLLRRPRLIWALTLLPPLLIALLAQLLKTVPALRPALDAVVAFPASPIGLPLGAALCLWALWRWVGNGDAAHWRDHSARLQARRSAQRGWMPGDGWGDRLLAGLGRCFTWPRDWHFQRVLHAGPVAKLDHLLSRNGHWTVRLWVALLIGGLLGSLLAFSHITSKTPERPIGDSLVGIWIGALSLAFAADASRVKTLWRRRREQAVLALLPGLSARPGELVRALSARWLRQGLLSWLLVLLLMLAYEPYTSPRFGAAMALALAGCLPLMLAGCLLDPARLREPQGPSTPWEAGVFLVCLAAWLLSPLGWPFAGPLLAVCVAAIPWALWRWRRLADAPAPFPVGRLADYSGSSVK